jgi:hypothetical protein
VKRKWDKEMAKTRARGTMMGVRGGAFSELLEGLRVEREKEEWECRKMYPPEGKKGPITKTELRIRIKKPSPLRHEIQPEDIDDVEDVDWNQLLDDFDKPMAEADIDGGTFMDFFEDKYGLYISLSLLRSSVRLCLQDLLFSWGPNIDFNASDLSSLQISDTDTKDETLNNDGYSGAKPDDEIYHNVFWDFELYQVPTFEEEEGLNNGEEVDRKDEDLFESELGGICTFSERNDKVSKMMALGTDAKLEVLAW